MVSYNNSSISYHYFDPLPYLKAVVTTTIFDFASTAVRLSFGVESKSNRSCNRRLTIFTTLTLERTCRQEALRSSARRGERKLGVVELVSIIISVIRSPWLQTRQHCTILVRRRLHAVRTSGTSLPGKRPLD